MTDESTGVPEQTEGEQQVLAVAEASYNFDQEAAFGQDHRPFGVTRGGERARYLSEARKFLAMLDAAAGPPKKTRAKRGGE